MTACPHCRRLREERDEALEALRQARTPENAERLAACMLAFKLSRQPARVLLALVTGGRAVSSAALIDAGQFGYSDDANNFLAAIVVKLRARLRPHGVSIETVRGVGYGMRADARARAEAIMAEVV